ncbi:hypothetical protein Nepgr_007666 [Nepenthes gracilis]|uniref:Phytocyanin domain-containing protein n=1 Tax=Nepenthes gracilis TaxID=150966 RepID=A0AAD3S8A0_NEPGR|nr:hypothetical protein Nepgr_007666 [Nepenthes gracilis]
MATSALLLLLLCLSDTEEGKHQRRINMASSAASKPFGFTLFPSLLFVSSIAVCASGFQFEVGGDRGWVKPSGDENETYNEWAEQKRFHIGDSVYFKYQKDSVLEVTRDDYENCIKSNPIARFEDGNTLVKLDRSGFFYFISGEPGHCESGQKIIIRVMVQSGVPWTSIASAPSPHGFSGGDSSGGGGGGLLGPATSSSAKMMPVTSFCWTAVATAVVILYLFLS